MINCDTPITDWLEQSNSAEHAGGIFVLERPLDYRDRTDDVVLANCLLHFPERFKWVTFGPNEPGVTVNFHPEHLDPEYKATTMN